MYMGELVRQVLVDLMKDDLIFVGADRWEVAKTRPRADCRVQGEDVGARQLLHPIRLGN